MITAVPGIPSTIFTLILTFTFLISFWMITIMSYVSLICIHWVEKEMMPLLNSIFPGPRPKQPPLSENSAPAGPVLVFMSYCCPLRLQNQVKFVKPCKIDEKKSSSYYNSFVVYLELAIKKKVYISTL